MSALDRTEADRRLLAEGKGKGAKIAFFSVLLLSLVSTYFPKFLSEARDWVRVKVDFPLPETETWRVLYESEPAGACDDHSRSGATCPASPENSALWESS